MTVLSSEMLHSSTVSVNGRAVMIEARSGSGKSDIALRLIDRGAKLVSDDYTIVRRTGKMLLASPPENIAGKIAVRGTGLVAMTHHIDVRVELVVQPFGVVERMPAQPAQPGTA